MTIKMPRSVRGYLVLKRAKPHIQRYKGMWIVNWLRIYDDEPSLAIMHSTRPFPTVQQAWTSFNHIY